MTHRRNDTTLARIIHLVESAQSQRAPVQLFIDRFAAWYTPAVVVLAVLVATVPVLLLGQPFDVWLYRSLVLLVVACPCALVISTPVSIVSALAGAARHGVLIKGGVHLERLSTIRVIAFDKTGTMTTGHLRVGEIRAFAWPVRRRSDCHRCGRSSRNPSTRLRPPSSGRRSDAASRLKRRETCAPCRAWVSKASINGVAVVCGTPRLFRERGLLTPDLSQGRGHPRRAGRVARAGGERRHWHRRDRPHRYPEGRRRGRRGLAPRRGHHAGGDAHRRPRGGRPRRGHSRRHRRGQGGAAAAGQGRRLSGCCGKKRGRWRWLATASTTPLRWRRPTSAS